MNNFEISTDSTCDLYIDEVEKLGIYVGRLNFTMEKGGQLEEYIDNFKTKEEYINFYEQLKCGVIAKTSILNLQAHIDLFTSMAKSGIVNALHISQSKGLSPTIENAQKAIEIVKVEYPNINYLALECNSTTVGEGMLVRLACKLRDEGKTNKEVYDIIQTEKNHLQHFVVVDDLMYLKRGGRISGPKALIGTMLNVKPIIQFTKEGKLEITKRVNGTNKALRTIVEEFKNFTKSKYFDIQIVHTNNEATANRLADMLEAEYGIKPQVRIMGPIIGTHLGPGAVAYAFLSNEDRPY